MTQARIFSPDKNAMQSGISKTGQWMLEYEPESPYFSDPLMGWRGYEDTKRQISLHFPTLNAAIEYAKKYKLTYQVFGAQSRHHRLKAYADNFKFDQRK